MTRLIVTSDRNGKSSVGVDRPIPSAPFASVPGFDPALIWGTAATPSVPWDGRNVADERKRLPGLAERFEPESPGMHTTDTVDYGILMEGEISLELDDGEIVALKPGDIVVQNGTRHAWRNGGSRPATLIFVLVGARRSNG